MLLRKKLRFGFEFTSPDNNVMHAKSGLRVLLEWKINRPDSVITAVIRLQQMQNAISDLPYLVAFGCGGVCPVAAVCVS